MEADEIADVVQRSDRDQRDLSGMFADDFGKEVGRARIPNTVAGRFGIDTFGVGSDTGSPVADTYTAPFPFRGTIRSARVETRGPVARDPLAELEAILSEQ